MANKKISAFTELTEAPATTDVVPVVDVSDTTGAPTGTTKKVSLTNLSAGIVDISTSQLDAASLVTESEGIGSNDNDTTLPTSAAVKDYVDTQVQAKDHLNELSGTLDDLTEGTTNKHFTASDETKLDGIETSATADQTGAEIKAAYEAEADTNAFTDADHTKLDGLEQSDWNSSSGGSQILNKPTIPSALNDLSNVNASPTDGQVLKWVNASSEWQAGDDSGGGGGGGGISNVSEDTTPQLGGDLDVNGNSIVSASNGDIAVTPDGTGKVVLDGINWPTADGSADQVLKTDGAGQLSFTAGASGTVTGVTGASPISATASSTTPEISIADASTSAKGAASFSSDNFSVSSGAVTIKSAGVDLTDEVTGSLPDGNIASASTWNAKIADVVSDTSPQLGGDLDVSSNKIVSASNGDIVLEPNGTGKVGIGGTPAAERLEIINTGADTAPALRITNDEQSWNLATRGDSSDNFVIRDVTGGSNVFTLEAGTGMCGIGTLNPSEVLTLNAASNTRLLLQEGGASKGQIAAGGGGLYIQNLTGDILFRNSSENDTVTIKDSGRIIAKKASNAEVTALTDGATITPDLDDANNFSVTLGGSRTLANPSNCTAGQSGVITITQDVTGSHTLAYGGYWKFSGGTAPTLTTTGSAVDVLAYYVESATRITATLVTDTK